MSGYNARIVVSSNIGPVSGWMRADAPVQAPSIVGIIAGDPAPGRSALDKRGVARPVPVQQDEKIEIRRPVPIQLKFQADYLRARENRLRAERERMEKVQRDERMRLIQERTRQLEMERRTRVAAAVAKARQEAEQAKAIEEMARRLAQEQRNSINRETSYSLRPRYRLGDMRFIQYIVADHYGVTADDLRGTRRIGKVVWARHVAIFLCRQMLNQSLCQVGRAFGNRDHTTAMHAHDRIAGLLETDEKLKSDLDVIYTRLRPAK